MPLVPVVLGLLGAAALAKGVLSPRITLMGKAGREKLPAQLQARFPGQDLFVGFYRVGAPGGEVQLQAASTRGEGAAFAAVEAWVKKWKAAGSSVQAPFPVYFKTPSGAEYFGPFTNDPDDGTVVIPMMFVPKGA